MKKKESEFGGFTLVGESARVKPGSLLDRQSRGDIWDIDVVHLTWNFEFPGFLFAPGWEESIEHNLNILIRARVKDLMAGYNYRGKRP